MIAYILIAYIVVLMCIMLKDDRLHFKEGYEGCGILKGWYSNIGTGNYYYFSGPMLPYTEAGAPGVLMFVGSKVTSDGRAVKRTNIPLWYYDDQHARDDIPGKPVLEQLIYKRQPFGQIYVSNGIVLGSISKYWASDAILRNE